MCVCVGVCVCVGGCGCERVGQLYFLLLRFECSLFIQGLKMRQVKQLCLLKLQSMTEEDIHSTVQSDDPTLESNLNNTLMQLLGHTVPSEDKNKSGVVNESRVDGASFSESTKIDEDTSKQNVDVKKGNDSVSECETESSHLCGDKQIDEDEKEIVICVSDVSDDEHGGEKKQSKSKCENVSTNVIDDDVYLVSQHSSQAPQENDLGSNFNNSPGQSTNCLNLTPDVTNRSVSSGESSDSEKDEETEDISEAGQILEMEMRRRALESALKRVNDPIVDQKSLSVASELLDNDSRQSGGLCLEPRADMSDVSIYRTEVGLEKDMNKTSSEAECITETSGSHSVPIQRQTEEETVTHVVPLCDQEQPTECLESESCELDGVGLMIEKRLREKLLQSLSKRK